MAYIKYGLINGESFSKNVPPGPKPWPIIGSLHLMASYTKYPFEVFTRLQKVKTKPRNGNDKPTKKRTKNYQSTNTSVSGFFERKKNMDKVMQLNLKFNLIE